MSPRVRLFVALVSTGVTGYIAVGALLGRVLGDSTYGQLAVFNEVVRIVLEAYVEPVNIDRAMAGARLGLTEALDGDSAYLDQDEFRAYQQGGKDQGGDVGLVVSRRFSFLVVVGTRAGSPAEKAGLRTGDVLKTIDGRHTRPLSAVAGQRLLRGAPGSVLKLTFYRSANEPREVSLVRERVATPHARGRMLEPGVAYVKVPEVSPRSAEEVRAELDTLRRSGARRLVLDLRGAAHGSPADGVKLAELFLKGGVAAKLAGTRYTEQVFTADASRSAWDLPMAVLVNTGSAGPAEIVAAALLDAGRSPVVGERTFGRASLQRPIALPEGGLALTVAKYMSPKGNAIHGKGVEPSVAVDVPRPDDDETEPATDVILDKALEVLKGEDAKKAA